VAELDRFRLDGRVALIPGGGGAIGSAIGSALAGVGAKVVVVDRTPDRADEAAARACALGGICKGVTADVTREEDAERIVKEGYRYLMCAAPRSFTALEKARSLAGRT